MKLEIKSIPFVATERAPIPEGLFEKKTFCDGEGTLPYRIYTPKEMSEGKKYPLILFFHGAGERGSDNEKQLINAIGQFFADPASPVYDCIVIAPQCPEDSKWVLLPGWVDTQYSTDELPESPTLALAVKLIEEMKRTLPIDPDRVYSTGLSMGAYATWDLLVRHKGLLAAALPVCGGCDYRYAERLKDMPICTFHGLQDPTVPPDGTERMVNALLALGSESIGCTYYIGGMHNVWETAFATEGLLDWLLSHHRTESAQ